MIDAILAKIFGTKNKREIKALHLIGGIALHRGRIAEMRTGEGKTMCLDAISCCNTQNTVHEYRRLSNLAQRPKRFDVALQ